MALDPDHGEGRAVVADVRDGPLSPGQDDQRDLIGVGEGQIDLGRAAALVGDPLGRDPGDRERGCVVLRGVAPRALVEGRPRHEAQPERPSRELRRVQRGRLIPVEARDARPADHGTSSCAPR